MSNRTYATALIAPDVNEAAGFQGTAFTGSFNGNTQVILNLRIVRDSSTRGTYFGLFGKVDALGLINNLSLKNTTVITETPTSAIYVGTLAGLSGGTILSCTSTGTITTNYGATAAGLAGYNQGNMINCQADVTIIRTNFTSSSGATK
jgi:hypothetical protein